jgi:hypothetical protein
VDGFSYEWDTSPGGVPDATVDAQEDVTGATSPPLSDGESHYFHLRTRDNAGNWTSTVHMGPFVIDTVSPTSMMTFPTDGQTYTSLAFAAGCASGTPDMCGPASDGGGSGVDEVEVQIQRAVDGLYWNGTAWQAGSVWSAATGTSTWTYAFDPDPGTYTTGSRAIDIAGNVETTETMTFTVAEYRPDGLIRLGSGRFVGNGVYNTTGADQTRSTQATRGQTKTFTVRIQSESTATDSFRLGGPGGSEKWMVKYLSEGANVTSQVVGGTFSVNDLGSGETADITLKIKPKSIPRIGSSKSVLVTATSEGDGNAKDAVKAKVTVKRG